MLDTRGAFPQSRGMEKLLQQIEAFCAEHQMSESRFGVDALNDKNFVPQLRAGRDLRFSTAEKCLAFMAQFERDAAA